MKVPVWLLLILCLWQAGCVHEPLPPLPREHLAALGTIGVVYAQYNPAFEFEVPTKGGLRGAAKGAVYGTGTGILLVPAGALTGAVGGAGGSDQYGAALGGLLGAAIGALIGAGYIIAGPIYGAVEAEPAELVETSDKQLQSALAAMQIQQTMRDHVVEAAQSHITLTVIPDAGPETPSDVLTYLPLRRPGVDSLLELRVTKVALVAKVPADDSFSAVFKLGRHWPINRPLSLRVQLRVRLIRLQDSRVVYQNGWTYEGQTRTFAEWANDNAKLFSEEFDRAYQWLAGETVVNIFHGPSIADMPQPKTDFYERDEE